MSRFILAISPYGKALKDFWWIKTNRKTNAFAKSDEDACNWVFLSAMIALKEER